MRATTFLQPDFPQKTVGGLFRIIITIITIIPLLILLILLLRLLLIIRIITLVSSSSSIHAAATDNNELARWRDLPQAAGGKHN